MRAMVLALAAVLAAGLYAQDPARLGAEGLGMSSQDGQFNLTLTTAMQFRYTYHDVRAQGSTSGGQNGADFNNLAFIGARTFLNGHFFGPDYQYRLWLRWDSSAALRLEDCWFRWAPHILLNVTAGQMRVPATWNYQVDHERAVFSDRDIADQAFNQGWGKGVEVSGLIGLFDTSGEPGVMRYNAGVYNGAIASPDGAQGRGAIQPGGGVNVTDFDATDNYRGGFRNSDSRVSPESFNQLVDSDLMFVFRLEMHPFGEIERHMADMENTEDTGIWKVMIAVSASYFTTRVQGGGTFLGNDYYNRRPTGVPQPPPESGRLPVQADIVHMTVDGHFRWIGLAINWAINMRSVKFTARGNLASLNLDEDRYTVKSLSDLGASVDVNYFLIRDALNLAVRFACVNLDEFRSREPAAGAPVDGDSFGTDGYEYGASLTWMIRGDNLKAITEYRYVAQQLPHGSGSALSGSERVADWYAFQEVRVTLQWIF